MFVAKLDKLRIILGTTWWKERTDCPKLSSDLYTYIPRLSSDLYMQHTLFSLSPSLNKYINKQMNK